MRAKTPAFSGGARCAAGESSIWSVSFDVMSIESCNRLELSVIFYLKYEIYGKDSDKNCKRFLVRLWWNIAFIIMKRKSPLVLSANKAIDNGEILLNNENTPFHVMYKHYKILQKLWFRVVEEAAETNSAALEDLSIDLEEMVQEFDGWIKTHSPEDKKAE